MAGLSAGGKGNFPPLPPKSKGHELSVTCMNECYTCKEVLGGLALKVIFRVGEDDY